MDHQMTQNKLWKIAKQPNTWSMSSKCQIQRKYIHVEVLGGDGVADLAGPGPWMSTYSFVGEVGYTSLKSNIREKEKEDVKGNKYLAC